MSFTYRAILASLALLAAGGAAAAQPKPLALEECVRLGLENSKALHASLMRVQAAEAKAGEAVASRLPSLKLGGAYTRLSEVSPFVVSIPLPPPAPGTFTLSPSILNQYSARLTLQQPIFTGHRLEAGERIARFGARATRHDYERDRADLAHAIRSAYWDLFRAIEIGKVADENVGRVKAHLADIRSFLAQGMVTENEVLKVEVQLSGARLLQIHARNAVRLSTVVLNNLVGLPLETEVRVASEVDRAPREVPSLELLLKTAVEARPEIRATETRVRAAEAGVTLARSSRLPQAFLTGNYAYARPNPRLLPSRDRFKGTWDLGLGVTLDVWNGGVTRHQTDQARAQLTGARDALEQVRDGVRLEVTRSFIVLTEAKDRIDVAAQAVRQAEESHRVTNEKFRAGLALNTDLLDAEVALLQAKTDFTQTLVDYEIALSGLRKATGRE
jgi:outer membrane protein TolC